MLYNYVNIISICITIIIILTSIFFNFKKVNYTSKKFEYMKDFFYKNYNFFIIALFVFTAFTSLFELDAIPCGLHVDEAGMAYDSISLSRFGVDRYLNRFPVYLINYGGGQSAMYAYISAFLVKLFGYSVFTIRLPAVIVRLLTFVSIYLIMKKDKLKSALLLFIFSICPYFIMQSRWGLDCNLLVGFLTISISLLIYSVEENSTLALIGSGLLFGLSLYTYALSYIIVPMLLLLILIYLFIIKKMSISKVFAFACPLFLLALPLLLMILVNNNYISEIKSIITIPKLPGYRGSEVSVSNIPNNLYILFSIFSFDNQEIFGKNLLYNSLPYFGTIYYMSIPFFIFGFIYSIIELCKSIKYKKFNISAIFIFWFVSVIICQLVIIQPNINKANAIFIPILYFVAIGIYSIVKAYRNTLVVIVLLLIVNFSSFAYFYTNNYKSIVKDNVLVATDYLDAIQFSNNLQLNNVYVENNLTIEEYIYVLLENEVSPFNYKTDCIAIKKENMDKIYYFSFNDSFDEKAAYIVKNNQHIINLCKEHGFNNKNFGNIVVFYPN